MKKLIFVNKLCVHGKILNGTTRKLKNRNTDKENFIFEYTPYNA